LAYAVDVVNVIGTDGVAESSVPATETGVPWLPSVTPETVLLAVPPRLNVCARPGTTMSSAVARNRTVLLKYV
jgi:hypothetical protein